MTRVLITGAAGMTGAELARQGRARGWETTALARRDLDITDESAVADAIRDAAPDVVVNAAAYTAVDEAEREPGLAMKVNRDGAANVARAAAHGGAALVHISTDYVFDGAATTPYRPDSAVNPISAYGATKLAGEESVRECAPRHAIVRSSWVYSHEGRNFVHTMLRLAEAGSDIRVVNDQHGSPTLAADLAAALLDAAGALSRDPSLAGTYHFANSGTTTWYGFAQAVFEETKLTPRLTPVSTTEFQAAARRPRSSMLDTSAFSAAFGVTPRHWRAALRSMLERPQ